jgi:hypothetical protein
MTPADESTELLGLLDAYLDDELAPGERDAVDALLGRSAHARAELADIDRVRSLVRGLGRVDPPFGFYERLTVGRRRRRAPGLAVAVVGAVAAAIVVVVAVTPVADRVAPPVEDLAARHTMLVSATGAMPEGYEPMPAEELDGAASPPARAEDFDRMAAYDAPEGMHVVYAQGADAVSVFEQKGGLSWSDLPEGGEAMEMDGMRAWAIGSDPATALVVFDRGDLVVTVIGAVALDDAHRLAEALPAPGGAPTDRLADACEWVTAGFGFPR